MEHSLVCSWHKSQGAAKQISQINDVVDFYAKTMNNEQETLTHKEEYVRRDSKSTKRNT